VAVWDALERIPGYAALVALLQRLFGDAVAAALRAPFELGDVPGLRGLFAEAGVRDADITTHEGKARFPSIRTWVYTEVRGWTAAELIDDAGYERLLGEAERALALFVVTDGTVAFPMRAHIVTATKPTRA
jgi:hypothetical protein